MATTATPSTSGCHSVALPVQQQSQPQPLSGVASNAASNVTPAAQPGGVSCSPQGPFVSSAPVLARDTPPEAMSIGTHSGANLMGSSCVIGDSEPVIEEKSEAISSTNACATVGGVANSAVGSPSATLTGSAVLSQPPQGNGANVGGSYSHLGSAQNALGLSTGLPDGTGVTQTSVAPAVTTGAAATHFSCVVLTDWLVHASAGPSPKSEILEFSWAVYDVNSECLLEKVRHIVRPTETSGASVSEALLRTLQLADSRPLERAKTLKQVLTEFDTACSMVAPPSVCVVVGSVKLRDQLLTETFRKGVPVPKCLRGVLDLATLAAHFYPQQFPASGNEAMLSPRDIARHLALQPPVKAEEFSSMDGCVVMSHVINKMYHDNIHFQPQHLSTVVTGPLPAQSLDAVAAASNNGAATSVGVTPAIGNGTEVTLAGRPSSAGAVGSTVSGSSGNPGDYVIRMRGVPWGVTEADVIRFVEPVCTVTPSDVHIATNYDGKASGEVFVRVGNMTARDKCLQELHGRYMGPRWIEVFKAGQNDLQNIPFLRDTDFAAGSVQGALRLRGLPWSTNEYEIVKFFADGGFQIDINSVVLGQSHDNRFNGDAWVLMESGPIAEEARRALHKKTMGRRYVELFQSTPREVEMARRGQLPSYSGGRGGYERPSPYGPCGGAAAGVWGGGRGCYGGAPPSVLGAPPYASSNRYATGATGSVIHPDAARCDLVRHCATGAPGAPGAHAVLRMRGLPYHANETHIVDFFSGFAMSAILPATAPIDGRPSGEAYVEFCSGEEAWRALKSRNGGLMERRYIELFPSTKHEMELAAAGMDPREIRSRCPRL